MSNITLEFPGCLSPSDTDAKDKRLAEAFRDLEQEISACVSMSQIARRLMPDETDGTLMFAVCQTKDMLDRLQKRYYALWRGEEEQQR
jgi:hypothetical protein